MQGFMLKQRAPVTITVTGSGDADRYYLTINGQKVTEAGTYRAPYGYAIQCFVSGAGNHYLGFVEVVDGSTSTTVASSQDADGVVYQYDLVNGQSLAVDLSGRWSFGGVFQGSDITITEQL